MRTSPLTGAAVLALGLAVSVHAQQSGRGMPADARASIHALFNGHTQIVRDLTLTDQGYVATTTSTNAAVVAALKEHVSQMSERLASGLMVRRWDPAFAEYASHYSDIDHQFESIDGGIRATVTGKTADAVKVAQNHAQVIVDFATTGWAGHERVHPAALVSDESAEARACCRGGPRWGAPSGTQCEGGCRRRGNGSAQHCGSPEAE